MEDFHAGTTMQGHLKYMLSIWSNLKNIDTYHNFKHCKTRLYNNFNTQLEHWFTKQKWDFHCDTGGNNDAKVLSTHWKPQGIVFAFAVVYNEYKREDHGPHGSPEETVHTIIS